MLKITFKTIHLHHFMSYEDTIFDLTNKGICLVKGINNCSSDSAKSNGSGKSTLFNAISFALFGETLNGLKSKLGNIYFNDGCYVELEFSINNDDYKIIRSKEDKVLDTNLKLFINDIDKSSKGLRETEKILAERLPDLTSELLGSVILLGQGLPQKFTANSPSGRKEVLEHLSHSDFMIQDLKERVSNRAQELHSQYQKVKDDLLINDHDLVLQQTAYNKIESNINQLNEINIDSYKEDINLLQNNINQINDSYNEDIIEKNKLNAIIDDLKDDKNKISEERLSKLEALNKKHNEYKLELREEETQYKSKIDQLKIKVEGKVCPYCHSRLDSDTHTHQDEVDLDNYKKLLKEVSEDIVGIETKYKENYDAIEYKYTEERDKLNTLITDNSSLIKQIDNRLSTYQNNKNKYQEDIISKQNIVNNYNSKIAELNKEKESTNSSIIHLQSVNTELNNKLNDIDQHININNKMEQYLKRDFRGILLKNVIDYINLRVKEYSKKIFNTDNLSFELDGNNININFCNKVFENLSGGEQQRVNLIIQFALRDMLCNYFDMSCNILALDEITDALDSVSCDKILDFIINNITDVDSLFIISHHSDELNLGYDTIITIEKDEEGVSHLWSTQNQQE